MTDEPRLALAGLSFPPAVAAATAWSNRAAALGVDLRAATGDDIALLCDVYASTRLDELAVTNWPDAAKLAFLEQQFAAQHRHYQEHYDGAEWLVIEQGGVAVGRLYLVEWASEHRIVDIALLPAARGGGVGSALLADLAGLSARTGKPLTIHVERNNPARHLYLRHGFVPAGEAGVYDLMRRAVSP